MEAGLSDKNISELLPFWVNGSLSADEAGAVAVAVADSPALAAEADFLRGLHARMQAEDDGFSPAEMGLARLKRSIASQALAEAPTRTVSLRAVAAAAVVAAMMGYAANEGLRPTPNATDYVQASGEDTAALVIGFQGTATAQAISDFLLAEGVIILDGPSALGLYRLAPAEAEVTDLAALADRMTARGDLFEVVGMPE